MEFNKKLLAPEAQQFILKNLKVDVSTLVLSNKSPFETISIQEIAQQVLGRQKLIKKAPEFIKEGIVFPPSLNLEQSSSFETAIYKRNLISDVERLIDLTGGFGIDTYYLSEKSKETIYCELNSSLVEIVRHNFSVLGAKIKCKNVNGIDFIQKNNTSYDVIFLDPSRRTTSGKVISLESSTPNLLKHWNLLLNHCKTLIVKLSPMLDIDYLKNNLTNIKEVHVISVKNDVKEILLIASNQTSSTQIKNIAADSTNGKIEVYSGDEDQPYIAENLKYSYLYEPYGVLLKTKLNDSFANELNLKKISYNSNFYLGNLLIKTNLFKMFKILDTLPFNKKLLKKKVGKEPIEIVCRNFPLKPHDVQKLLSVKHGGKRTLICTSDSLGAKICFITNRILS